MTVIACSYCTLIEILKATVATMFVNMRSSHVIVCFLGQRLDET